MADEDPKPPIAPEIKADIDELPAALEAARGPPSSETQNLIDNYVDTIIKERYEGNSNAYALSFLNQLDSIFATKNESTIKSAKQILVSLQQRAGNERIQEALDEIDATLRGTGPSPSRHGSFADPVAGKRRRTRRRKTKVRRTRRHRRGRSTRRR
jgi:hypothetical protein